MEPSTSKDNQLDAFASLTEDDAQMIVNSLTEEGPTQSSDQFHPPSDAAPEIACEMKTVSDQGDALEVKKIDNAMEMDIDANRSIELMPKSQDVEKSPISALPESNTTDDNDLVEKLPMKALPESSTAAEAGEIDNAVETSPVALDVMPNISSQDVEKSPISALPESNTTSDIDVDEKLPAKALPESSSSTTVVGIVVDEELPTKALTTADNDVDEKLQLPVKTLPESSATAVDNDVDESATADNDVDCSPTSTQVGSSNDQSTDCKDPEPMTVKPLFDAHQGQSEAAGKTTTRKSSQLSIDPSVSHILDFSSDHYATNFAETFEYCQSLPPSTHMKKRKSYMLPPDPRPILGCTWCGPPASQLAQDIKSLRQIKGDICPACKYFADQGWARQYDEPNQKIMFTRPDGPTMTSVKAFLQESTGILAPKLGFQGGIKVKKTTKVPAPARNSVDKRIGKRSERKRKAAERFTYAEKAKPTEEKARPPMPKKQKQEKELSVSHSHTKKEDTCTADPRPVPGCEWCYARFKQFYEGKTFICESCQFFVDQGMTRYHDIPGHKIFYYDKNGKILYSSTKQYVKGTTEVISSMKQGRQPKNDTLEKKRTFSAQEIEIPETELKRMEKRRRDLIVEPDMRPIFGCLWCGSRAESKFALVGDVCAYCSIASESGWTCKIYESTRHYRFKNQPVTTINRFIAASTNSVCDAINAMSRGEIEALKPRYFAKKDPFEEQSLPKSDTKEQDNASIPTPKKAPGSVSEKKERVESTAPRKKPFRIDLPSIVTLLEQEKGLMGVLQADVFHVFNTHFGSNQTIACKILLCLGSGDIPSCVLEETPFKRTTTTASHSEYIGVVCADNSNGNDGDYGVAIPQLHVENAKDRMFPRETTVNGQTLLIRNDINDEEIAGKLFAFMYRILYGSSQVANVLKSLQSDHEAVPEIDTCVESKQTE